MVTYREEEAILDQARADTAAALESIREKSRIAGLLLAANGVLITFFLGLFFSIHVNTNESQVFYLGSTLLNIHLSAGIPVYQIYSFIPIMIFCISAFCCVSVFDEHVQGLTLRSTLIPYVVPIEEKLLKSNVFFSLIARESYCYFALFRAQINIFFRLSAATTTFTLGIIYGVINYLVFFFSSSEENFLFLISNIVIFLILVGWLIIRPLIILRKKLPAIDESLEKMEKPLREKNII